ncbi:palmitoyltransferase ZDHHC20-A-like [Xenopus laevis]|uniref:Palmitoyltransferase n=1 Tax=Xenopus laevis TaxID=8355 RepID=A0A8J1KQY4_XENLA|nr:palmitoyltransferase ZDHHC20-A-like [Xenopus laevis]
MSNEEKDTKITINEKEEEEYQRSCMRKISRIVVLLLIGLLATCYYIFVVELCIFTVQLLEAKVTFLVIFHLLFLLCVWCYLRTVMTPPAVPPEKFRPSEADKQLYLSDERPQVLQEILIRMAKDLHIKKAVRYCTTCHVIKPDRCHHCPVCNVCILKLDHHCGFLNNCVGFSNYKFFLLAVMYGVLLCIFTSAVSLYCSILFWTHQLPNSPSKVPIIVLFSLTTFFAIMLFRLFLDHFELALRNITDREDSDNTEEFNPYNLGFSKNLREVFGNEKKYWFLPIFSSLGDGVSFPMGEATMDIEKNAAIAAKPPSESNSQLLEVKTTQKS